MKNNTFYNLKSICCGQFRRKNFKRLMKFSKFFKWFRKNFMRAMERNELVMD